MPNIFHQSVEDILKAATPEQRLIWNSLFLKYGERIAISQYCYSGIIPTPMTLFVSRKLYFAYQLTISDRSTGTFSVAFPVATLYDEANANMNMFYNLAPFWDATAAAYKVACNPVEIKNIVFSRIGATVPYNGISFIGYMINY